MLPGEKFFLFTAMFGQDPALLEKVSDILKRKFGPVIAASELFDFSHTDYYEDEMGKNLKKIFFAFKKPIRPERLIDIKLSAMKIESRFSITLKRRVNLDPGYISPGKVVLATHKDYSHRIYLGKGVYAEVTLFYKDNSFNFFPWTYPDYKTTISIDFFNRARKLCYNK